MSELEPQGPGGAKDADIGAGVPAARSPVFCRLAAEGLVPRLESMLRSLSRSRLIPTLLGRTEALGVTLCLPILDIGAWLGVVGVMLPI